VKKAIFIFFFIFIVSGLCYAGNQTNYTFRAPSPAGHYETLTLVPQTSTPKPCTAATLGMTYSRKNGNDLITYLCTSRGWEIIPAWHRNHDQDRIYLTEPDMSIYPMLNVGIGTNQSDKKFTPFKLTIDGDGGILARGTYGSGEPVPYGANTFLGNGMGTIFMWHPEKAALRILHVDGTGHGAGQEFDPDLIGDFSVAMGKNTGAVETGTTVSGGERNLAVGNYSTVGGGYDNVAGVQTVWASLFQGSPIVYYDYATIGGGIDNSANDEGVTIGGGRQNSGQSKYATIAGGQDNRVYLAASGWSTVGGGKNNRAGSANINTWDIGGMATVSGGGNNAAIGFGTTISGGYENLTWESPGATIGGGGFNEISRDSTVSTIAGGRANQIGIESLSIPAQYSTIGGGWRNQITGNYSFIGGGGGNDTNPAVQEENIASGDWTTIGGGTGNTASGIKATIAGGQLHQASGSLSFVGGGTNNSATNSYSSVLGGRNNRADGESSAIAGGVENDADGMYAFIAAGAQNKAHGNYSMAAGRKIEIAASADNTFAWGHDATNPIVVTQPDSFIIATGNMGVGTTTPTHTLHINDVLRLEPRADAPICSNANIGILYFKDNGAIKALCSCRGNFDGDWINLYDTSANGLCN